MEILLTLILISNIIGIWQAWDHRKLLKKKLTAMNALTFMSESLTDRINKIKKDVEKLKSQS